MVSFFSNIVFPVPTQTAQWRFFSCIGALLNIMSHPRSVVQQQQTSHASQNPIGSADGPHIWTVESTWHKWYETAGRNTTFLLWDHMAAQPSQSSGVLTCQPSRFFSRRVRKLFGWFSIVKHDVKCISADREYGGKKPK